MRFVFLGPELCLRLPSRVSSRSYGCRSARGSQPPGPPGDSHPQVTSRSAFASRLLPPLGGSRHAWRTEKRPASPEWAGRSSFSWVLLSRSLFRPERPRAARRYPYWDGTSTTRTRTTRTHRQPTRASTPRGDPRRPVPGGSIRSRSRRRSNRRHGPRI